MPNNKPEQFLAPKRTFQWSILKTTVFIKKKKTKEHFPTKITFIVLVFENNSKLMNNKLLTILFNLF